MKDFKLKQSYQKNILKTLNKLISQKLTCTYQDLTKICQIPSPYAIRKVMNFLEKIVEKDIKNNKSLRAALIVSKIKYNNHFIPSEFFFDICKKNNIFKGNCKSNEAINFHKKLLDELFR